MNRAIFFSSFFSTQISGSKFFTSPAIWQSNAVASNAVMRAIPLLPASRLRQTSSVPMPHPQTRPTPVTTTRRFKGNFSYKRLGAAGELLTLGVLIDVLGGVFNRGNLLGVFIRNFDAESLFESHDQLDCVE